MKQTFFGRNARRAALVVPLGLAGVVTAAHGVDIQRLFIDDFLTIPSSVSSVIGTILPESNQVGKSFLSSSFSPNLEVTEDANVFVSFVHEGASFRNSLGYFTYTDAVGQVKIVDRQLVLPNASYADPNKGWGGGTLVSGDTVTLRDASGAPRVFHPGEHVGFFLVADGWNNTGVRGWNTTTPLLPSSSAATNATNRVFTSIDVLNPENSTGRADVARHVAMLRIGGVAGFLGGDDFILMGFEDQRRDTGSDNDFNDLVLLVRSNPIEAIQSSTDMPYYVTSNPDPDGDGVKGLSDYFPLDGTRAFITRTPAAGWSTIAFEDRYPDVGDLDYNDSVVDMAFEEVLAANGRLKDLVGTFHLVARGATLDHRMGVAIHGLPEGAAGTLRIERFSPDGERVFEGPSRLESEITVDADGKLMIALDRVFPSTMAALPGNSGLFANTVLPDQISAPASARFVLSFDAAVTRSPLGAAPFDPFLQVVHDGELWDVHTRGKKGFPTRPASLPSESGVNAFVGDDGHPFALLIPVAFRYPLEREAIDEAYPGFKPWRASGGTTHTAWYTSPKVQSPAVVVNAPGDLYLSRPWTVAATNAGAQ